MAAGHQRAVRFDAAAGYHNVDPCRIATADTAPSTDSAELADKGSVNQRAVLANRAHMVEAHYADPSTDAVITARGHA